MSSLPDQFEGELQAIGEDVDSVIQLSVADAEANSLFTAQIAENLIFFGKSLAVWEDELAVPLPESRLDPVTLTNLYIDLANKIQKADHYLALSRASETISSAGVTIKKGDIVSALIGYYHKNNIKVPPGTVIDRLAENYVRKLTNINSVSRVVRDYWKAKVQTLKEISTILSQIAINNATAMKYQGD
jgi:hypothetical protein